jgi:hypothetical protein
MDRQTDRVTGVQINRLTGGQMKGRRQWQRQTDEQLDI